MLGPRTEARNVKGAGRHGDQGRQEDGADLLALEFRQALPRIQQKQASSRHQQVGEGEIDPDQGAMLIGQGWEMGARIDPGAHPDQVVQLVGPRRQGGYRRQDGRQENALRRQVMAVADVGQGEDNQAQGRDGVAQVLDAPGQ